MEIEILEASPDDAATIARLKQQIALETERKSPDNVWWIQSAYVTRAFRCRGVYSALYAAIQEEARNDSDACGIPLCAEKSNEHAQATCRALGTKGDTYLVMETMF